MKKSTEAKMACGSGSGPGLGGPGPLVEELDHVCVDSIHTGGAKQCTHVVSDVISGLRLEAELNYRSHA